MKLNKIGQLAEIFWAEIPNHFPFAELGAFVIMPNHVHGILIINKSNIGDDWESVETLHCNVCTNPNSNPNPNFPENRRANFPKNEKMSKISPKAGSISTIIRSYKSVVTKYAHRIHTSFGWQERFYDHIIRDEQSYNRITDYIINNPKKWNEDKFH